MGRSGKLLLPLWLCLSFSCKERPHEPAPKPRPSAAVADVHAFTPSRVDRAGDAMGTKIRLITYTTERLNEAAAEAAFAAALAEIRRVEDLMTTWREDSELSQVNAHAGQWRAISPETQEVFEKSQWASELSGGAFDVTFHALSGVWKFGDAVQTTPSLPDPKTIAQRLRYVDYRKVQLDRAGHRVRLGEGTSVDFGGIAKGYAVDRAATVLKQRGLNSFLLQAGGDLFGEGQKPDGSPWTSGIRDPRGGSDDFFALIELQGHAFSTAGDYARAFILSGKRYHHIIDPKTGYPATASRSVTIWAEDAFTADAIDDAVFILGPKHGLELVESLPGVGAVIVDADNHVWISQRLQGKVKLLGQPSDGI